MAEAKKNYANIENINTLLGADGIGALLKEVQGTEKKVGDILRKLSDLEGAAKARAQEEAEKVEPGITFLEPDCRSCFGASENQCKRCEEERHG